MSQAALSVLPSSIAAPPISLPTESTFLIRLPVSKEPELTVVIDEFRSEGLTGARDLILYLERMAKDDLRYAAAFEHHKHKGDLIQFSFDQPFDREEGSGKILAKNLETLLRMNGQSAGIIGMVHETLFDSLNRHLEKKEVCPIGIIFSAY